jgi:hypothetical protein
MEVPGFIARVRTAAIRALFGDAVFISYARADGSIYAGQLAGELAKRGFSCRFD